MRFDKSTTNNIAALGRTQELDSMKYSARVLLCISFVHNKARQLSGCLEYSSSFLIYSCCFPFLNTIRGRQTLYCEINDDQL